jgi:hypothetical protein
MPDGRSRDTPPGFPAFGLREVRGAAGGVGRECRGERVPGDRSPTSVGTCRGLDGKTLWGSRKPGAPGVHLRSALAHQVDVTLAQQAVAEKTNEITAAETVRSQLVLAGRVVTRDALLTQTAVAQTIVDTSGAYGMVVKANPPQLRADSALICANPLVGDSHKTADTLDIGHARMEPRRFTASQALTGYRVWPELAQGFALERSGIILPTSEVRAETVHGMTSLVSHQATPTRLLELVRGP